MTGRSAPWPGRPGRHLLARRRHLARLRLRLSVAVALAAGTTSGAGLALLGALPAGAATPTVVISSPANGASVSTSTPTVQGSATANATGAVITGGLELSVTSPAGHPGYSTAVSNWCGRSACSFTLTTGTLAYNGSYNLSVTATESDPPTNSTHPATTSESITVAVPPAAPSGLSATPASDGSSVTVAWQANPEPDIVGYEITRSPASPGSWPVAVQSPGLVDHNVTSGTTYTYQVSAVRPGGTSGSTLKSSPSSTSATPVVPASDPTPSSGGSSGSSGSGSTGSGSTSGSASGSGSGGSTGGGSTSGSGSGGTSGGSPSSNGTSGGSSLGTYGKAGSSGSGSGSLASFDNLLAKSKTQGGYPAEAAPGLPSLPPLDGDGVAPGSDNPAVAPFSRGSGGLHPQAGGPVTISYAGDDHSHRVRDVAAVALGLLLLAVAVHLLWLRRAVSPD